MYYLKRYLLSFCFIIFFNSVLFSGFAFIDAGQNTDRLYYKTGQDTATTGHTDIVSEFSDNSLVFSFEILYDSDVFELDNTYLSPGLFLTDLDDPQTDTYIYIIQDNKSKGVATVIGARMIVNDEVKGVSGIQSLIESIRFNVLDISSASSSKIELTNFEFYSDAGDTIDVSNHSVEWSLVSRAELIGDINNDGVVNSVDFSFFRRLFGKYTNELGLYKDADITEDGSVNESDFEIFKQNFGVRY